MTRVMVIADSLTPLQADVARAFANQQSPYHLAVFTGESPSITKILARASKLDVPITDVFSILAIAMEDRSAPPSR